MTLDYRGLRSDVLGALRELGGLAEDAGAESLAVSLLDDRIPRLEAERLHLVVLGEFNHGKTTFVNALLGGPVLPTGVTPTTAVVHEIHHGEAQEVAAVHGDGARSPIATDALEAWIVGGGATRDDVRHLEVRHPSGFLADGVVLVDTPGVNDLNLQRAEITYGYLPRADAVVFLLDAGQILKASEREFLEKRLLSGLGGRIVFVVNKVDVLDGDEVAQAVAYARTHLAGLVDSPTVLPLSAERGLEGAEGSGLETLVRHLQGLLRDERGRVLLEAAAAEGRRVAAILRASVEAQRRAIHLERAVLDERLARLSGAVADAGAARETRERAMHEALIGVKAVVRADVERFADRLAGALPAEIEDAKAEDLRQFLPGFLEERFRTFAEEQAREVAGRLERIAEDAIAYLGDDVEKRAGRLADALGDAAPKLALDGKRFVYDVGVFALGAFGLTLMALSNVIVGGAMTLAAPVLAVVFRGRADRELKRRAAEEAPRAVREAAAAMSGAFEAQIDAFGERLRAFLAEADEDTTRSLAEVLGAARDAADQGADARAALEARARQTLSRLAAAEQRLARVAAAAAASEGGA